MISVLHTIGSLACTTGGPARSVAGLCDGLAGAGIRVEIVCGSPGAWDHCGADVRPAAGQITRVPRGVWLGLSDFASFGSFNRAIAARCASKSAMIIHDHGLWLPSNHASSVTARKFKIPWIVSPRGMLEPWAFRHRGFKKRVAWWLYQRRDLTCAAALHATSDKEADSIRRFGLKQPVAIVPNGIGFPQAGEKHMTKEGRTALFIGRFHPVKGLVQLVHAWGRVRPKGWRLVIVGPDECGYRRLVEAAVRETGLRDAVALGGPVADEGKNVIYRSADLFILPSLSENFGVVVAEALACELPVIATKGTPWVGLERYECGWWVDSGVDSLAWAIQRATSLSDEERKQMGRRGRAYVQKAFSWKTIAEQLLAVYLWILGHGPRPGCVIGD